MVRRENEELQLIIKIALCILLSYLLPIIGLGFSIYVLTNYEMRNYRKWVKILAGISLIIQLLLLLGMGLGWLTWVLNPGKTFIL